MYIEGPKGSWWTNWIWETIVWILQYQQQHIKQHGILQEHHGKCESLCPIFFWRNEWPLKAAHLKTCQITVWFGLKHFSNSPRHQCFEISCEDAWIINTQTVQRLKHSSTIWSLDCFSVLQRNKKVLERRFFTHQVCIYHVDFTETSAPVDVITVGRIALLRFVVPSHAGYWLAGIYHQCCISDKVTPCHTRTRLCHICVYIHIYVGACLNPVTVEKSCSLFLPSNLYLSTFIVHWRWWRFVPFRDPAGR